MKRSYSFLLYITLLPVSQFMHSSQGLSPDQELDTQLNALQQSIDTLVAQSVIDPDIAQDITDKINNINQHIQTNIQADANDIKVAAALNSILEASTTMTQTSTIPNAQNILNGLKHAARINTLHTLITGAFPNQLKDQALYTDSYTESIGFTLNNWIINGILQTLLTGVKAPIPGTTMTLDITSPTQAWLLQVTAGVISHFAWLLQKKLALSSPTTNS